jgi:hypothetical protein
MKPEFEKYRGDRGTAKDMVSFRVPVTLKTEVELVALAESDTISGLMIEGLARVLEDRKSDPNYTLGLRKAAESQVLELEDQLSIARSLLEGLIE